MENMFASADDTCAKSQLILPAWNVSSSISLSLSALATFIIYKPHFFGLKIKIRETQNNKRKTAKTFPKDWQIKEEKFTSFFLFVPVKFLFRGVSWWFLTIKLRFCCETLVPFVVLFPGWCRFREYNLGLGITVQVHN
ncbi:hypothetical protein RJT34_02934 [Clitoria ternatea]|uniref:Uncharacterized protein n=1 Tax=Clitoria ternatea TaxID=43366 RepID=A0AAN9KHZ2_CLITE